MNRDMRYEHGREVAQSDLAEYILAGYDVLACIEEVLLLASRQKIKNPFLDGYCDFFREQQLLLQQVA